MSAHFSTHRSIINNTGFVKVGGFEALRYKYSAAIAQTLANNTTCGLPDPEAFHIFRDPIHGDHPWPGLFLQASIGCLWYWCADQVRIVVVIIIIIILIICRFGITRCIICNSFGNAGQIT